MLKVVKNRKHVKLVNQLLMSKKKDVIPFSKNAISSYSDMPPIFSSNENNEYMRGVIKEGDRVLAIAGAFDHLADMVLYGAKNIVAVDVNELQFPVCWLKYFGFCFFHSCNEYVDFLIDPTSDKMLDKDIMNELLDFAPDGEMKEFWRMVYRILTPYELRKKYLYGEKKFLGASASEMMFYQYLLQNNFYKVKERLNSVNIYLQKANAFYVNFFDRFDVIHLSNIHNFVSETLLQKRMIKMHSRMKNGAKVIIYCIGMRKSWFDIAEKGDIVMFDDLDVNEMDEQTFYKIMIQVELTMSLYLNMLDLFDSVEIVEVRTGRGLPMYNTGTDCVMILTK